VSNDADDEEEDDDDGQQRLRKRKLAIHKFVQNGAMVDLSSDPYGWENVDDDTDTESNDNDDSFLLQTTISCSMKKLQPIVLAIRRAAANIERRRPNQQPQQTTKMMQTTKPIPIVFESLTPLLHLHGVDRINLLIKSLGAAMPSPSTPTEQTTMTQNSDNLPILSPIVAPILYESLRPSEHRSLEDIADAMIHINLMDNTQSFYIIQFYNRHFWNDGLGTTRWRWRWCREGENPGREIDAALRTLSNHEIIIMADDIIISRKLLLGIR